MTNPFNFDVVHLERHGEAACGASRTSHIDRTITAQMEQVDCHRCKRTQPYKQWRRTLPPTQREPSDRHYVYPLGTYEQMIVGKAMLHVIHPDLGYDLSAKERADLILLTHIFRDHGTVTIIRAEDEQ